MMSDKFKNVPVDAVTCISFELETKLGDRDVLYQKWFWDGIKAECLIFLSDDVSTLTDANLELEVRDSPVVDCDSEVTIKRTDSGFTFVNFNFLTMYDDEGYTEPEVLSPEKQLAKEMKTRAHIASSNQREIERIRNLKSRVS